jgi:hypothetical protein
LDETRETRYTTVDVVGGLLAACSLALSGIALADTPAILAPAAALVAIIAARMSTRFERLAHAAMLASVISFILGMTLAVITENALL